MVVQGEIWTSFVSLWFNLPAKFVAHGAEQHDSRACEFVLSRVLLIERSSIVGDEAARAGFDAAFGCRIGLNPLVSCWFV
jgi:hypothetical protein